MDDADGSIEILRARLPRLREPMVDRPVPDLPFRSLYWEDFEDLLVAVAKEADGVHEARRYGRRGQAQAGIDIWGEKDGRIWAYQGRRLATRVTAEMLRAAVSAFANPSSKARASMRARKVDPFKAQRFTYCSALPVADTAVDDELIRLRQEYSGQFEIDLYDAPRLNGLLSRLSIVVHRFFGAQAAAQLMPEAPPTPARDPLLTSADALLNTPIEALGLTAAFEAAEAAITSNPLAAAQGFAGLVQAIESDEWHETVANLRARQAEALAAAGELEQAAEIWLASAESEVEDGSTRPLTSTVAALRDNAAHLNECQAERFRAVSAILSWFGPSASARRELRVASEALLAAADAAALRCVRWLVEISLVDGDRDAVTDVRDLVPDIDDSRSPDGVRVRLALADATGDWSSIVNDADTVRLRRLDCGLVWARRGRWLAWHGDPYEALRAFRRAVPHLHGDYPGDVSELLYSMAITPQLYGWESSDSDRLWSAAYGVRGTSRLMTSGISVALNALREVSLVGAERALRRRILEASISGHIRAELEAHQLLGEMYRDNADWSDAAHHLILAGRDADAAKAIEEEGSWIELDEELTSNAPWVLSAALHALAAEGDLAPVAKAREMYPRLRTLASGAGGLPTTAQVLIEAAGAVSALVLQLDAEAVAQVLGGFEPLIPRGPTSYRHTDTGMVQAFEAAHRAHPELRPRARDLLLAAVAQQGLWGTVDSPVERVAARDAEFVDALRDLASQTPNPIAARAIALAGDTSPPARGEAHRLAQAVLDRPTSEPRGRLSGFGSVAYVGRLSELLDEEVRTRVAERLVVLGQAASLLESARGDALQTLALMGPHLPTPEPFFDGVVVLARGEVTLSPVEAELRRSDHRRSAFRVRLPKGVLHMGAAMATCALARTAEQAQVAEGLVQSLLWRGDELALRGAVAALSLMPVDLRPPVPMADWARHPSAILRRAAAWFWCRTENPDAALAPTFIEDMETRWTLATNLSQLNAVNPELGQTVREQLRNDASAAVRLAADTATVTSG